MTTEDICRIAFVSTVWLFLASVAMAQTTVYKWVDEEGVVHFGESPPAGVEAERITTQAAPQTGTTPSPELRPANRSATTTTTGSNPAPAESTVAATPAAVAAPASEVPLAELDARCDAAREAKIAPLRAAEIENCKAQPRSDPTFCEQFNADFGEGGRTRSGSIRPRMFDDLPECVQAMEERNRRTSRRDN